MSSGSLGASVVPSLKEVYQSVYKDSRNHTKCFKQKGFNRVCYQGTAKGRRGTSGKVRISTE